MSKILEAVEAIEVAAALHNTGVMWDPSNCCNLHDSLELHLATIRAEAERLNICHHDMAAGSCGVCDNDE